MKIKLFKLLFPSYYRELQELKKNLYILEFTTPIIEIELNRKKMAYVKLLSKQMYYPDLEEKRWMDELLCL